MSPIRRHRAVTASLLLVATTLVLSGCAVEYSDDADIPPQSAAVTEPEDSTTPDAAPDVAQGAEADLALLASAQTYSQQWNDAAAGFVSGYADESVSAETFVADAEGQLTEMGDAQAGIESLAVDIQDPSLSRWMYDVAQTYDDKLSASEALVRAVESGTEGDQEAAVADLTDAVAAAQELAAQLPDALQNLASDSERAQLATDLGDLIAGVQ